MKKMKWVTSINLVLILGWAVLLYFIDFGPKDFGNLGAMFVPIVYQFLISIFLSILLFCVKEGEWARAFLASAFICLIIGSSTCFAIFD